VPEREFLAEPGGLGFVGEQVVVGAAYACCEEFDKEAGWVGCGDRDGFPDL